MAGPVASWGVAPVYGTWRSYDGSLKAGKYLIEIPARVTNTPQDSIIPSGVWAQGVLNVTAGSPSMSVDVPLTDDTDNLPQNWQVKITITFDDRSKTEVYTIDVLTSTLSLTPPGVNLRTIVLPQLIPNPQPMLVKGVPGGIAALDSSGNVLNAAGDVVSGGAATTLTSLSDVDSTGITTGDVPTWDGSKFTMTAAPGGASDLSDLGDTDVSSKADGQVLAWNADASKWMPQTVTSGGSSTLAGLTDVDIDGIADGQALLYDSGTGKMVPGSLSPLPVSAGDVTGLATVATSGSYDDLTGKPTLLAIGTTSSTAKAGNYAPAVGDITGTSTAVGNLLAAADAGAARTAIGALAATYAPAVADVTGLTTALAAKADASTVTALTTTVGGKADAADLTTLQGTVTTLSTTVDGKADTADLAAVATSGAYSDLTGTPSLLTIGTTSTTAKAGDYAPAIADVTGLAAALALYTAIVPVGSNRPATTGPVLWAGDTAPTSGGTTDGGTALAVAGLDWWLAA